jgi:uncharacterized protein
LLTVTSAVVSEDEAGQAASVAKELGLEHEMVSFDWLKHKNLADNPTQRCYACKKAMASLWKDKAKQLNLSLVVEGTTASEVTGYRPGAKALKESGIISPLLEAEMTKRDIREFARENNLSVAETPSMACLATRFPYGTHITEDLLERIKSVEDIVRKQFKVECVRARYQGNTVRIEVGKDELEKMAQHWKFSRLVKSVKKLGFLYVTLDLEGYRTGSMDEGL